MHRLFCSSHSSWSAPIIVVPKGDDGKCLVIDYRALDKVTWKFIWPMPRVEDIFPKLNDAKYFSTLDLCTGYHHIPLGEDYSQNNFYISFWKIQISEGSIWTGTSTSVLPRTERKSTEGPTLCYCLPRWYYYLQQNCRRTLEPSTVSLP